jgi:alanyl-tRNA synthetase
LNNIYKISVSKIIPGESIFYLHDTCGIPYSVCAIFAKDNGLIIDWSGFITCAKQANWNTTRLKNNIIEACKDAGWDDEYLQTLGEVYAA